MISPVAVMTWATRYGRDGVHTVDLIVLWRGAPGWFVGSSRGSSGGGGTDSFQSTARYGDVEVHVTLQTAKRIAEVQGQKVELGDANVILVDAVDLAGSAKVVSTLRIDPAVPVSPDGRPRVMEILRRSPEILAFLQCQTPMPDAKGQASIDAICAQVIGKSQ